jgi:poly(3-hydroxybutyrate) depolymerase
MAYTYNDRSNILVEPLLPDGSLVVALHGGGGTPADLQAKANLEATLTNSYIIYASADASLTWKSGSKNSDVAYLHSLIEKLAVDYPSIDLTKVHLFGHSNGGMMCYKLAAVLDELGFASVTVISGCYVATKNFDYPGKVLHIHTYNDDTVSINGNNSFPGILYTMSKVNEFFRNSTFDIRAEDSLVDSQAHKLDVILSTFPDIPLQIKEHMGL